MRTPTHLLPFWHKRLCFALADTYRLIYEIDAVATLNGVAHRGCCWHGFNMQFAESKWDSDVVVPPVVINIA